MPRYAVFGDSYVRRQGLFGGKFPVPGEVRFFGKGGMRVGSVPGHLWSQLKEYHPDVCFLHLGGNDINFSTDASVISGLILDLVYELQGLGAHVLVGEILPRAKVRGDIDLATFEKVRKAVNVRLRRRLRRDFVFFRVQIHDQSGGLHSHYDPDGVHLSITGQDRYHRALLKAFGM